MIPAARFILALVHPAITSGRVLAFLGCVIAVAWGLAWTRTGYRASAYCAWSCVVTLLVANRAELTLACSAWFSSLTHADRVVRALRGTAEVLGWLALAAWAIEGHIR